MTVRSSVMQRMRSSSLLWGGWPVQIGELFIEGLVHVSTLTDDYYHYIEKLHCLRGERRKRVFRIGDAIRVRVDRVDAARKRIDFSMAKD